MSTRRSLLVTQLELLQSFDPLQEQQAAGVGPWSRPPHPEVRKSSCRLSSRRSRRSTDAALLALYFGCGMRRFEALSLFLDDIDMRERPVAFERLAAARLILYILVYTLQGC